MLLSISPPVRYLQRQMTEQSDQSSHTTTATRLIPDGCVYVNNVHVCRHLAIGCSCLKQDAESCDLSCVLWVVKQLSRISCCATAYDLFSRIGRSPTTATPQQVRSSNGHLNHETQTQEASLFDVELACSRHSMSCVADRVPHRPPQPSLPNTVSTFDIIHFRPQAYSLPHTASTKTLCQLSREQ